MPSKQVTSEKKQEIYNIFGWSTIEEVAQSLWSSNMYNLLHGDFVFAYRGNQDIKTFIITRRKDCPKFMVGLDTPGWSMQDPGCSKAFLVDMIETTLKEKKLDKIVLENLKKTIEQYD